MQCVARRIVDREVLRLIKMWLTVPVEEQDENGTRRLTGGKDRHCGTPQGGVVTPPTMWQTAGFQVRARWAWCVRFHAKNYLHGLRAYFYALDQSANQLPPPGPVGLLQTGCNTLGKLF